MQAPGLLVVRSLRFVCSGAKRLWGVGGKCVRRDENMGRDGGSLQLWRRIAAHGACGRGVDWTGGAVRVERTWNYGKE